MTPVPQYATWEEHRRALSQTAEEARSQHAVPRPAIEIINEPESITVSAQLPGFESDNIQIKSTDTMLTISATRDEYEGEGETLHSEWHSDVQRTIPLPVPTNPDKAEVTYESGILKITLPKEEGQQVTIPI
ncbi:Hsp20/alpha crystallin family protein [Natrinema halophilum]|uniref:Hsp20/alpha crystallin family protein n=1 Tax=Natrinema halophilum TaxID=1699371 RepID=A0A7D5L353_9EURY|nr:Hsp20/alpha crystallin family protein [Natrinema halophilum]QLG47505.1 Hsp20/alpha crystallin family protein [Natrinema halophilum]